MWDQLRIFLFGREAGPIARASVVIQPIALNPDADERIGLAVYRVDAIRRHIEQREPDEVSPQRMREFHAEMVAQTDLLLKAGVIDLAQHDALIALTARR